MSLEKEEIPEYKKKTFLERDILEIFELKK